MGRPNPGARRSVDRFSSPATALPSVTSSTRFADPNEGVEVVTRGPERTDVSPLVPRGAWEREKEYPMLSARGLLTMTAGFLV